MKQTVGITLLVIAFAWLIGSLPPRALMLTFAILICALGVQVAAAPVFGDWRSTQISVAAYDLAIADLQTAIKGAVTLDWSTAQPIPGKPIDYAELARERAQAPARDVTIPESARQWMRPVEDSSSKVYGLNFPETMADAEIMRAFKANSLLPRPTFSLGSSVRAHAWNVSGGRALFISGLSVLGWLSRRNMK